MYIMGTFYFSFICDLMDFETHPLERKKNSRAGGFRKKHDLFVWFPSFPKQLENETDPIVK